MSRRLYIPLHQHCQNSYLSKASIAACLAINIPKDVIINGIKSYSPLKRRFSILNQKPLIIDDFAHNPDGIKATIKDYGIDEKKAEEVKSKYLSGVFSVESNSGRNLFNLYSEIHIGDLI